MADADDAEGDPTVIARNGKTAMTCSGVAAVATS